MGKKVAEKEQKYNILKKFLADKKQKEKKLVVAKVTTEEPLNNNVEAKGPPPHAQEHGHLMSSLVCATSTASTGHVASATPLSSQSAITDLERTASLRGITVLR